MWTPLQKSHQENEFDRKTCPLLIDQRNAKTGRKFCSKHFLPSILAVRHHLLKTMRYSNFTQIVFCPTSPVKVAFCFCLNLNSFKCSFYVLSASTVWRIRLRSNCIFSNDLSSNWFECRCRLISSTSRQIQFNFGDKKKLRPVNREKVILKVIKLYNKITNRTKTLFV
jgi:hypothetical protein